MAEDFHYDEEEMRRRYGKNWLEFLRRLWQKEHEDQERKRKEQDKKDKQNGHHDK